MVTSNKEKRKQWQVFKHEENFVELTSKQIFCLWIYVTLSLLRTWQGLEVGRKPQNDCLVPTSTSRCLQNKELANSLCHIHRVQIRITPQKLEKSKIFRSHVFCITQFLLVLYGDFDLSSRSCVMQKHELENLVILSHCAGVLHKTLNILSIIFPITTVTVPVCR